MNKILNFLDIFFKKTVKNYSFKNRTQLRKVVSKINKAQQENSAKCDIKQENYSAYTLPRSHIDTHNIFRQIRYARVVGKIFTRMKPNRICIMNHFLSLLFIHLARRMSKKKLCLTSFNVTEYASLIAALTYIYM